MKLAVALDKYGLLLFCEYDQYFSKISLIDVLSTIELLDKQSSRLAEEDSRERNQQRSDNNV